MSATTEQVEAALAYIKGALDLQNQIDALRAPQMAALQHAADVLQVMDGGGGIPERVLFCSPVTGTISDTPNPFGLDWYAAVSWAEYYTASGAPAYHTGVDLNRPAYGDSGKPVYAAADGMIVFAGTVSGWQQKVVVIRHVLEDDTRIWTRYAHIKDIPGIGQISVPVKRGEQIGVIADYLPVGAANDHLHFDVCIDDLGSRPGDWPGMSLSRLKVQYKNPLAWLKERSK